MPLTTSLLLLIGILCSALHANAGDNLLPAPPNCATAKIGKAVYVKGEVYISCHQDTISLKEFGFRNFQFVGRAFRSVKYFALWPVDIDVKALPEAVTGLNYDRPPDEMVLENLSKSVQDPEVRAFLFENPTAWSAWPNVSDIRGSGVNGYGWYEGGRYNSSFSNRYRNYGGFSGGAVYGSHGQSSGGCYGGSCGFNRNVGGTTRLRPNDFGILRGYQRAGDGQVHAR